MSAVSRWSPSTVQAALVVTLGLMLAVPATASAQSCAGICGTSTPGSGCFCDAACVNYGDCCGDYQTYCASSGPTCETMCNSSSDCGHACPVGDGTNSWCGHYSCYTPEEDTLGPCTEACDTTSSCSATCVAANGSLATCGAYACTSTVRPSFETAPSTSDPCTQSGSGPTWSISCDKSTQVNRLGGSALGMDSWGYYASRLSITQASAQSGVKARFYIAGREIGSASQPALDAYALVRPLSTDCKDGQTGIYLRSNGSVVWKRALDKTCMTVPTKLTQLPGQTGAEVGLYSSTLTTPAVIFDSQIPYASVAFSYRIHGITASVSAVGRAKLQYTQAIRLSTREALAQVTPEAIGYIDGGAGVGFTAFGVGAEMGIKAKTSLVDYVLPHTLNVTTPPGANTLALTSDVSVQRKANQWDMRLYLKAYFAFWSKTWTHPLASGSWAGDGTPNSLFQRSWSSDFGGLDPLLCTTHAQNYQNTWPTCGDGICNGAESSCGGCSQDCGPCGHVPLCGDGLCEPGESCWRDCNGGGTCRMPPCTVNPL